MPTFRSMPRYTGVVLALLLFAVVSVWIYALSYRAPASVALQEDAGNILSFIAAREHRDIFASDPVLGDFDNFRFYYTAHFPLIIALARLTGDYGSAMYFTFGPHIFVQLVGFYLLGRVLYRNHISAVLLALASLPMLFISGIREVWGLFGAPIPRITFQALMPYLLALAVYWQRRPPRWVWLMVLAGLLVYVHPVSAPILAFALWMGLAAASGQIEGRWRRVAALMALGGVFLLVVLPFGWFYAANTNTAVDPATYDYDTVFATISERYGPVYLDMPAAIAGFFETMTTTRLYPLSVMALGLWYALARAEERGHVRLVIAWIVGVAIAAMLIQTVEQAIEQRLEILPVQVDLIRGIRYLPVLAIVAIGGAFAALMRRIDRRSVTALLVLVQIALVATWWYRHPPANIILQRPFTVPMTQLCVDQIADEPCDYENHVAALDYLREATDPATTRVFSLYDDMALRYYALRSVVYADKDLNVLGYANAARVDEWEQQNARVEAIRELADDDERFREALAVAQDFGATHVYWHKHDLTPNIQQHATAIGAAVVFTAGRHAVIELP
ncbi:MAG: hypothetical protein AAFV33_00610 [Chloroflexota bacterium]